MICKHKQHYLLQEITKIEVLKGIFEIVNMIYTDNLISKNDIANELLILIRDTDLNITFLLDEGDE